MHHQDKYLILGNNISIITFIWNSNISFISYSLVLQNKSDYVIFRGSLNEYIFRYRYRKMHEFKVTLNVLYCIILNCETVRIFWLKKVQCEYAYASNPSIWVCFIDNKIGLIVYVVFLQSRVKCHWNCWFNLACMVYHCDHQRKNTRAMIQIVIWSHPDIVTRDVA